MSQYKVPQDVEAEDKLLGPLTLKQFIYAIVTILLGYVAFLLGKTNILLMLPFVPPIALFGFMAAPFTRDQPTDVYLGARLRFLFKPRKRVWDQSGMEELVKITVPKKLVHQYTNNLNAGEVRSRLEILASTIDSRGWATKNAYVNDPTPAFMSANGVSDRLIDTSAIAMNVPETDITAADDMLDPNGSRIAYHMDMLATQATSAVREQALAQMEAARTNAAGYQPVVSAPAPQVIAPSAPVQPRQPAPVRDQPPTTLLNGDPNNPKYNPYPSAMRQHVVSPKGNDAHKKAVSAPTDETNKFSAKATTVSSAESAKLELSQRDDLSVETIAREAERVDNNDGEVVINLH
jgi:hypothetical protein